MQTAKLVLSLDFELHWGVFDTYGDNYDERIMGARVAIPKILELFKRYDVKATWATVGLLFNESIDDYKKYKPKLIPSYKDKNLNAYNIPLGENEHFDKRHYSFSLIQQIQDCAGQELGSHSYSHYYCQSEGQTIEEFADDIRSAVKIAKDKLGLKMKSFVFPKNMVNEEYLEVLKQNSFSIYRESPPQKFKHNVLEKIFRFLNSYFRLSKYEIDKVIDHNEIKSIIGSRFLRPYNSRILNYLMLRRIEGEMSFAAKKGSIYHLWWHPHNFGKNLDENLKNLERILTTYTALNKKYGMRSVRMADL
jgi:peptidoglycan/xylan/chitin deacetylase (PgdA/CDA1 family)